MVFSRSRNIFMIIFIHSLITDAIPLNQQSQKQALFIIPVATSTENHSLYAKNANKKRASRGRKSVTKYPRKRGRSFINYGNGDEEEASIRNISVPKPSTTKQLVVSLDRQEHLPDLRVCIVEIDDAKWWECQENDNPFGAKLWPSSLGVAKFLASLESMDNYEVLELGCGIGLASIVAAKSGAKVIASDISDVVLHLTQNGWLETRKQPGTKSKGSLDTLNLNLLSDISLPLGEKSPNTKIVIATAVLYDASLAKALAKRIFEASSRGAWVIIGDDDTGERDGGRQIFLEELNRLEYKNETPLKKIWKNTVVKYKPRGWSQKQVTLLHVNPPSDINL